MTLEITVGDGAQALDLQTLLKYVEGNAVLNGLDVSVDSGDFDASDTLTVASGDVLVDGTEHSVSSTGAGIDSASDDPRKDILYVDGSGTVQVAQGQALAAQPTGAVREHTFAPSPPDLSDTVGVPIAEVWADPEASNLQSADVRDRRSPGKVPASVLEAIDVSDLDFDPATQSELDTHENNADAHHSEAHASEHHEGAADAIDADDLGASGASDGHVLTAQGDGTNAYEVTPTGQVAASETDDGSDITQFSRESQSTNTATIIDVTGAGIFLGARASCSSTSDGAWEVTVDGGTTQTPPWVEGVNGTMRIGFLPPIAFDSSLDVTVTAGGEDVSFIGWVKQ